MASGGPGRSQERALCLTEEMNAVREAVFPSGPSPSLRASSAGLPGTGAQGPLPAAPALVSPGPASLWASPLLPRTVGSRGRNVRSREQPCAPCHPELPPDSGHGVRFQKRQKRAPGAPGRATMCAGGRHVPQRRAEPFCSFGRKDRPRAPSADTRETLTCTCRLTQAVTLGL